MDKQVILWALLRRLKSSGFFSWDDDELAFVKSIVEQASFADCLPFLTDRFITYYEGNEDRKAMAEKQYESRKDDIDNWFATYKPAFQEELKRLG
ncbi:MAG: hypothetical protein MJZ23_07285 [Paludibacteraceae bacterium]|nr:hypothetical protein [Paludibacteraceae bacterium]